MAVQYLLQNTVSLLQLHLLPKHKALVVIIHHGNSFLICDEHFITIITKNNVIYKNVIIKNHVFICPWNDKKQKQPSVHYSMTVCED